MGKGPVKKKLTPGAVRRRKAKQRIRKKVIRKVKKSSPSWKEALRKSFIGNGEKNKAKNEASDEVEVQGEISEDRIKKLNNDNPVETQLFLRNIPSDSTADDVKEFFLRFGPVRRVLLVRNKTSDLHTGSAFLHCGSVELATKIFDHARENARELQSEDRLDIKTATAAVSRHKAKTMIHNRRRLAAQRIRDPFVLFKDVRVTVFRAVSRTTSVELTSAMEKKRRRTKVAADDPRNLYLLQEGLIDEGSPAARELTPKFLQMLRSDYETRKQKLRNTNMFVSKVRLSIRNLPRTLDLPGLRKVCIEAARKYYAAHPTEKDRSLWGKHGPLKQATILRDITGTSRGFGFIEMCDHNAAMGVLRALNNNPTIFGPQRRPIVSFAIEDNRAIQKLKEIHDQKRRRIEQSLRIPVSDET